MPLRLRTDESPAAEKPPGAGASPESAKPAASPAADKAAPPAAEKSVSPAAGTSGAGAEAAPAPPRGPAAQGPAQ